MSFEPINIFSRRIDPQGVAQLLRGSGFEMKIDGSDRDWKQIVLTIRERRLFRPPILLTFGHKREWYEGDQWPRQVLGMQGYFSGFPETANRQDILRAIGSFQFLLAVPQHDLNIDSDDERLGLVYAVCRHLDGVIFTPASLRDARGRILIEAGGGSDPKAKLPQVPPIDPAASTAGEVAQVDDSQPVPKAPLRVARRALALTAVSIRATLEIDPPDSEQPETYRRALLGWLEELDISDELEPDEWKVLERPVRSLEPQVLIDAMWRVEGLAVLAWALQRQALPPDDELVDPISLYQAMGQFDVEAATKLLRTPRLRSRAELGPMQVHLLMLNWRLRQYSLHPEPVEFVEFSKQSWIGAFDISTFRLIDNDLAIGDVAIAEASEDELSRVGSLAQERHRAINWLMGGSEVYSRTDTST